MAPATSGINDWAGGMGANLALTTQKDLVKLRTATLGPVSLRAVRIGLEIMDGLEPSNAFSNPSRRFVTPFRSQRSDWKSTPHR